jgi:hypothetical protein
MAKKKRVETRSRQRNWALVKKAEGNCPQCGESCDFNARTGALFFYCFRCRPHMNEVKSALMRRRRSMGIA